MSLIHLTGRRFRRINVERTVAGSGKSGARKDKLAKFKQERDSKAVADLDATLRRVSVSLSLSLSPSFYV